MEAGSLRKDSQAFEIPWLDLGKRFIKSSLQRVASRGLECGVAAAGLAERSACLDSEGLLECSSVYTDFTAFFLRHRRCRSVGPAELKRHPKLLESNCGISLHIESSRRCYSLKEGVSHHHVTLLTFLDLMKLFKWLYAERFLFQVRFEVGYCVSIQLKIPSLSVFHHCSLFDTITSFDHYTEGSLGVK